MIIPSRNDPRYHTENEHTNDEQNRATFDNYADLPIFYAADCTIFLNNAFQPSKMTIGEFDVFTFDAMKEPRSKQMSRCCAYAKGVLGRRFCRMIRPKKV